MKTKVNLSIIPDFARASRRQNPLALRNSKNFQDKVPAIFQIAGDRGNPKQISNVIFGIITVICILFASAPYAGADGIMFVEPPESAHRILAPGQSLQTMPVKYHRVTIDINNGVASTSIDQVFINETDNVVEGTYIFPLPENVSVSDFAMYMNGKRVSGEILDKNRAREIYESIVRRMKDPGLLEYIGRNMFKARVYPIPARGEQRIELAYQQTLDYDNSIYSYRYPLNTERFSPLPLKEVTISANITSNIPIKSIYSPSHDIDVTLKQYSASIGYEEHNVKPDKDFLLYYTVSEKDLGLNLLTHRKAGEDGYFLMMLSPGDLEAYSSAKDIIFVLDTSGSMKGEKIKQAKDALKFCIQSLGKDDLFNVINFATDINAFRDTLVNANRENTSLALDFIDSFMARGGTNINDALLKSLGMFEQSKRPRMVVFLTDGEPTVGQTDINTILAGIKAADSAHARIFVFGVGNDVNTHFLDRLSEQHKGVSEYVMPLENIEIKVSSFYTKINEPVLADISLDFGKIDVREIYPYTLPDIFKGTQLVMLGKYRGEGASAVTLSGYVNSKKKQFVYEDTFPLHNAGNDFIPRIWAARKIGYLTNEIRLKGENPELVNEIMMLSKEHGIMTPYTSFLILANDEEYSRWGIAPKIQMETKKSGMRFKRAMESPVGSDSVSSAKDILSMKNSIRANEYILDTVKHAGSKTFYLKDNVWIDASYDKSMKARKIHYLSKAYFLLIQQKPELAKYFALGENVIVVYQGQAYKVTNID